MTFFYTYGSVSSSAIIKEAFAYTRSEQIQRFIQKVRSFGTLITKWDISIKYLPSQLMEPIGRRERKILRVKKNEGYEKTQVLINKHKQSTYVLPEIDSVGIEPARSEQKRASQRGN